MYSDNLEGWIYGTVQDYEYCCREYPEKVKEFSSVKKEWQGLTAEEIEEGWYASWVEKQAFETACWWANSKLKEKNI